MNKEEFKYNFAQMLHNVAMRGFVETSEVDSIVDKFIKVAEESFTEHRIEGFVRAIKDEAKKNGLEAKVTIEYK